MDVLILPPVVDFNFGATITERETGRTPAECFLIGLTWFHEAPGERRAEFPGWSWAGWIGKLGDHLLFCQEMKFRLSHTAVGIEKENDEILSFPNWPLLSSFLSCLEESCRFIHIEASTFPIQIVYLDEECLAAHSARPVKAGFFVKPFVAEGRYHYTRFHYNCDVQISGLFGSESFAGPLTGILLADDDRSSFFKTALVIQEMNGYAEQRGVFDYDEEPLRSENGRLSSHADFDWLRIPKLRRKIRIG